MKPSLRRWRLAPSLGLLLAGLLAYGTPVTAAEPSLQEFLGRAQSQSDKKAVDDLIDQLKGGAAGKSTPAAPAPNPPQSAAPAAPAPPAGEAPPSPKAASPAKPPPAISPEAAVQSAEKKQLPSVDLEVLFEYDSATITPQAYAVLTTLGRALADARLAEAAFLVAGHTDAKGGDDYNLALSEKRAQSVRQFLIENFKIDQGKLVAKGFGRQRLKDPKRPLAPENRRVQIVNLSK